MIFELNNLISTLMISFNVNSLMNQRALNFLAIKLSTTTTITTTTSLYYIKF